MKKNKKLIISAAASILILTCNINVSAQNDIQISNFMVCGQTYNPAFAANTKTTDATILVRQQWYGFKDAPSTQLLNFKAPFKNMGYFGLSVINDKLGFEKSINARIIYAYPFRLNENSFISPGLGIGFINRSLEGTMLRYEDKYTFDPTAIYNNTSEYNLNTDMGIAYVNKKMRLGVSTSHFTGSPKNATFYSIARHYYFFGSYNIKLKDEIYIVPSLYVKNSSFITQYEINANMLLGDRVWCGASYRLNESVIGLIGMKFFKWLTFAYSYDYNVGAVKKLSSGSHEIVIITTFGKSDKSGIYYKTPRLFN